MDWNKQPFQWKNEPRQVTLDIGKVSIVTQPHTDFWQRTHYGFRNDSGHCYLKTISGDFTMETHARFAYQGRFDQCGVMLYHNEDVWMKGSVEKENEDIGRLGSVVTNMGYSDWATADVPGTLQALSYRLHRRGNDFLLECAYTPSNWLQMRIFHLHGIRQEIQAGLYACSPLDSSFTAEFTLPVFSPCGWEQE